MTDKKGPALMKKEYMQQGTAPKVSVITVVYNDIVNIRETIESFFSQTWENKEYIIIDGGSTDGTVDVIKSYSDQLSYWCSEADGGIYDAMNKGIAKATGDWICFLNCGDSFTTIYSIEKSLTLVDIEGVDVIYGNSIELSDIAEKHIEASSNVSKMNLYPIYRHGSSLVRAEVQKRFLFDLSKQKRLHYALDWEMIYRMFKAGCVFRKVNIFIESYRQEGTSNHPIQSRWLGYLVTSEGNFNLYKFIYFLYNSFIYLFVTSKLYLWVRAFFMELMLNDILPLIPFWCIRKFYFKCMRMHIGKGSFIMKRTYIQSPNRLYIGEHSHINRDCILDARGGITIGSNVSISHRSNVMTGGHDYRSPYFTGVFKPIEIGDYVWVGVGCTVLQGVHIGKGAVICSGAVVTKDVGDYEVVAGIPAHRIGTRPKDLRYHCYWDVPFT